MRRSSLVLGAVALVFGAMVLTPHASAGGAAEAARAQLSTVRLPFIANQGQVDARVAYYAPTFAGTLFVTRRGELVYALRAPRTEAKAGGWSLTETLIGGRPRPRGGERSPAGISVFLGADPARWRSGLPTWEQVSLGEVWPAVDVALRARGHSIEKVFTVHPGGAVTRIRLRVAGAQALAVDGGGALVARTGLGDVTVTAPVAYQEHHGERRPVRVAYRTDGFDYGFDVGAYDPARPLVIDPLLQSTYLGGTAFDDGRGMAIHPLTGDVYLAGYTESAVFPGTAGGAQPASGGGIADAFLARFSSTLTTLIQATFLGAGGTDRGLAVAIHPATGDVYLAGETNSVPFPGTTGGAQPAFGGGVRDAFVARFPSTLTSLTQTTYLGGADDDAVIAIEIHPATGDVYVAGQTKSTNFPGTATGAQPAYGGGVLDGFLARLPSTLTALTRATYLGGSGLDAAADLAIHPVTGDVYLVGTSDSNPFPGTGGGAQPAYGGGVLDGFIARFTSALTTLIQTTYLGGALDDGVVGVAIHPASGDVYVTGFTQSSPFPGTAGGAQPAFAGVADAFVARLPRTLTSITQATYLGGTGFDRGITIAIHPGTGDAYVAGYTNSTSFPGTAGGAQPAYGGGVDDVFVARLPSALTSLTQSTYLGGSLLDNTVAVLISPLSGNVYVAGLTQSTNFPGTAGGAQPVAGGSGDAFVALLTPGLALLDPTVPVPTLSRWAWLVMVALLLGTGVLAVRRRRWAH